MLRLFARLFIKNSSDTGSPIVRQKWGILCGTVGIFFNIILFVIKAVAAILSQSVSILADAANNLSDAASSIVTILGFKLSGYKPDKEHPFGHGRFEYVAGLIVAFLIFGMAVELLRSSAKKVFSPTETTFSLTVAIILIISIAVKFYMFAYNYAYGRKLSSPVLINTAKDSISDVVTTSVVLLTSIITWQTGIQLDGIAGILVALFIFKQAYEATRDTISPLLGEAPSDDLIKEITGDVLAYSGVIGVHDIIIHNYGPTKTMMSLHVEVPAEGSLLEVHDLIDEIEHHLDTKYNCLSVIHMDPVDTTNSSISEMKRQIGARITKLGQEVTFHDFRIIHHDDQQIIAFDVVVPFDFSMSDGDIIDYLSEDCTELYPDYKSEITIDKQALEEPPSDMP